jgi:hypothetical protein
MQILRKFSEIEEFKEIMPGYMVRSAPKNYRCQKST